jgi:hypothetical protein
MFLPVVLVFEQAHRTAEVKSAVRIDLHALAFPFGAESLAFPEESCLKAR